MDRLELLKISEQHYEINKQLRGLASTRLAILQIQVDAVKEQYSEGKIDHDSLANRVIELVDPDSLDKLSRIITRAIDTERQALCMSHLDLNRAIQTMSGAGYAAIPKRELHAIKNSPIAVKLSPNTLAQVD